MSLLEFLFLLLSSKSFFLRPSHDIGANNLANYNIDIYNIDIVNPTFFKVRTQSRHVNKT